MNIFVANLNFRSSSEDLRTLFEKYGEVSSANVITDKMSGRSRGFGFVEMADETQAQQAIQELNNTEFDGKVIAVSVARPRTERPQRNFRSNNRDNWNRNDRNQY
ncbi:MAG: RNA-binding protein [Bacteroidetes bacterium]|nr:RNA-binding protein [Bacteroidota bacterium]